MPLPDASLQDLPLYQVKQVVRAQLRSDKWEALSQQIGVWQSDREQRACLDKHFNYE